MLKKVAVLMIAAVFLVGISAPRADAFVVLFPAVGLVIVGAMVAISGVAAVIDTHRDIQATKADGERKPMEAAKPEPGKLEPGGG